MKRDLFKRATALGLVLGMVLSVEVFATSGGTTSGSISGDATIFAPTFDMLVPTNVHFTVDPYLSMTGAYAPMTDSQIRSNVAKGYAFVNKSDVPVLLTMETTLTLGKNVYVMAENEVNSSDPTNLDKELYFGVKVQSSDAVVAADGSVTTEAYSDDPDANNVIRPNIAGTGKPATLLFQLGKATGGTPAADSKGAAAFSIVGKVNPVATWVSTDVQLNLKFSFSAMTEDMYSNFTPIAGTLSMSKNTPSEVAFSASRSPVLPDFTYKINTTTSKAVIDIGSGNKAGTTVSNVKIYDTTGEQVLHTALTTDYTYTTSTKTLLYKGALPLQAGDYKYEVLFANGKRAMGNFTIVQ